MLCRLLIKDPRTRQLLSEESLLSDAGGSYRVNFGDLDEYETSARQALRLYQLDFQPIGQHDDTVVHLVIIGLGAMGQSLALHTARIGHFANEVGRSILPLVTVVDTAAQPIWPSFAASYPSVNKACVIDFKALDPSQPTFIADVAALAAAAGTGTQLVTYGICFPDDDERNLRVGLELARALAGRPVQILIHQSTRCGFAALFPTEGDGPRGPAQPRPFGMREDLFAWDVLLHESEDAVAAALHEDWRQVQRKKGVAEPEWSLLSDNLKDSNRQAADHIAVKLRAIGYHTAPLRPNQPRIDGFDDAQTLLLAKMEHQRWWAERCLSGWQCGQVRDREKKISPYLAPWDQLPPDVQENDISQVKAIPRVLKLAGLGIYR